jgi:hypothetical protein
MLASFVIQMVGTKLSSSERLIQALPPLLSDLLPGVSLWIQNSIHLSWELGSINEKNITNQAFTSTYALHSLRLSRGFPPKRKQFSHFVEALRLRNKCNF